MTPVEIVKARIDRVSRNRGIAATEVVHHQTRATDLQGQVNAFTYEMEALIHTRDTLESEWFREASK